MYANKSYLIDVDPQDYWHPKFKNKKIHWRHYLMQVKCL